jgi:acetyltransferase-like isoleucine patch superfamily enzyme
MNRRISPFFLNYYKNRVGQYFWWLINTINAKWWHVNIGKHQTYRGKVSFRKWLSSSISIGDNCVFYNSHNDNWIGIYCPCILSTLASGANLTIGNNCGMSGTVIGCANSIKIGNNVRCGANTLITDTDWHTDDLRTGKNKAVIIDDDVWLGYGVKVLKGVHIGRNSVIGAGSVVTHDIPANVIAAGNPCRIIKTIGE